MKVYISGPMTGLPLYNKPAFYAAEALLLSQGYEVLNPVRNELPEGSTWTDYMREDIAMMLRSDAVCTLSGWDKSRGAKLEVRIAQALGMEIKGIRRWSEERSAL